MNLLYRRKMLTGFGRCEPFLHTHALMICCMPTIFFLTIKAVMKVVCLRILCWKWIVSYDLRDLSYQRRRIHHIANTRCSLGRPITLSRRRSEEKGVSFIMQEKVLAPLPNAVFHSKFYH